MKPLREVLVELINSGRISRGLEVAIPPLCALPVDQQTVDLLRVDPRVAADFLATIRSMVANEPKDYRVLAGVSKQLGYTSYEMLRKITHVESLVGLLAGWSVKRMVEEGNDIYYNSPKSYRRGGIAFDHLGALSALYGRSIAEEIMASGTTSDAVIEILRVIAENSIAIPMLFWSRSSGRSTLITKITSSQECRQGN